MLVADQELCTGCGACVQACPTKCISWAEGELGFLYPVADESKCIECGRCHQVCPIDKPLRINKDQSIYAAVNKNADVLDQSTSGGVFSILAEHILNTGGIVYGCEFDESLNAHHVRVGDAASIEKLRGAKYVQSNTEHTFAQAKKDLEDGMAVLFSGTPCQIAGLYAFLGKEYENLFTVDLVCHGVASQAYFKKFLEYIESETGPVTAISFRDKSVGGWSCNGSKTVIRDGVLRKLPLYNHNNYYYHYYLQGEIYRKSCYTCRYACLVRQADITLGDYWGAEKFIKTLNCKAGCSLVMINNKRGDALWEESKNDVDYVRTSPEEAVCKNRQLKAPSQLPPSRKTRTDEYVNLSGKEIQSVFLKTNALGFIKGSLKTIVPTPVKSFIKRFI